MKTILVRDSLTTIPDNVENLPASMKTKEKKELLDKAYSALILDLSDKISQEK